MSTSTIESRLAAVVRQAGGPECGTFTMGVRAYTDWLDKCWSDGVFRTVKSAFGYGVELDESFPPDHVLFEVHE